MMFSLSKNFLFPPNFCILQSQQMFFDTQIMTFDAKSMYELEILKIVEVKIGSVAFSSGVTLLVSTLDFNTMLLTYTHTPRHILKKVPQLSKYKIYDNREEILRTPYAL